MRNDVQQKIDWKLELCLCMKAILYCGIHDFFFKSSLNLEYSSDSALRSLLQLQVIIIDIWVSAAVFDSEDLYGIEEYGGVDKDDQGGGNDYVSGVLVSEMVWLWFECDA
jgi:hypothetical protein